MASPRVQVTEELLRQAWRLRCRPSWPPTYAAAMAHPLYRGLVRSHAIGLAQAQQRRATRFDPRRAAANDTD